MPYGLDKHDKVIKPGMLVKSTLGHVDLAMENEFGEIGINASDETHPNFKEENRKLYLLEEFDHEEFELISFDDALDGKHSLGMVKKYLAKKTDSYDAAKLIEKVLMKFGITDIGYVDGAYGENFYAGTYQGERVSIVWDYFKYHVYVYKNRK